MSVDDSSVLAMLRESLAAGFSCVDLQGRFLRVNSGLCRMLGYTEQQLLAMNFAQITHPDDHDVAMQVFQKTADGEYHTSSFEKRYVRRGGDIIWVLVSPTLVCDDRGRPSWYATVTLDITERKRAEVELQRSEERYRTYVDAAPDGVFVIDGEGRYVDVNAAACRLVGFSREELLSMSIQDLVALDQREDAAARLRTLAATGWLRRETSLRRKDGSSVPVALDSVKLSDGRMMGFCKDITDRIQAEQERRTIEEKFRQTQKLESLGVLAGGIAHDFNNLLVGMLGNAELLLINSTSSSPAHIPLQDIAHAAERAAELCQQMLAYSGQTSVSKVDLDLSRAVQEMGGLLGRVLSNRASITYDLDPNLPPIRADAAQVRQVIMNLITNAAEANQNGAVRIEVATGMEHCDRTTLAASYLVNDLPEGRYTYLQVEDDGAGMDPETMRQMFDPFFTTKTSGRGLGLSALLGIVRAHGGAVRVDSVVGRGTTFRVIFPQTANREPRTEPSPPTHVPDALWSASGTVLLVDDKPLLRSTMRSLLEALGFDVITAASGAEALAVAEARSGDLRCVLLDYSMPGMMGNEVLARLRKFDAEVPVLILSGFGDKGIEAAFAGLSVTSFVQKPFRITELIDKLRQALGG